MSLVRRPDWQCANCRVTGDPRQSEPRFSLRKWVNIGGYRLC